MSTNPQRVHLSANPTDTAILISENKAMPRPGPRSPAAVPPRSSSATTHDTTGSSRSPGPMPDS